MAESSAKKQVPLNYILPPELELGVYASIAQVQARVHDYIITFYDPILPPSTEVSKPVDKVDARAVSRVVIPRGMMLSLIGALTSVHEKAQEADKEEGTKAE